MPVVLGIAIYILVGVCFSLYLFALLQHTKYFEPVFILIAGILWPVFGLVLLVLSVYYKIRSYCEK
jgi:hypothetical protein